jgi:hypothetical protein
MKRLCVRVGGGVIRLQVEAVTIGTSDGFLCQENNHGVRGGAHVVCPEARPERKNTLLQSWKMRLITAATRSRN